MEYETISRQNEIEEDKSVDDSLNNPEEPDIVMFAGMFRVGMDMVSDSGALLH